MNTNERGSGFVSFLFFILVVIIVIACLSGTGGNDGGIMESLNHFMKNLFGFLVSTQN